MTISEIITTIAEANSDRLVSHLQSLFPASRFGLLLFGIPHLEPGQTQTVDGSGTIKMRYVTDPNGKKMIKLCADPTVFDVNYPGCINATMSGREAIEMAEKLPDADGILVCSATSFHSFPIYKNQYSQYVNQKNPSQSKKFWQFWK